MIFRHFDIDDTDYISRDNIIQAMTKMGKTLTKDEVDEAFKQHDVVEDGKISFEEFRHMFFPENEDLRQDILAGKETSPTKMNIKLQ